MTPNPVTLPTKATIVEAAREMESSDIGDVIVVDGEKACGIVTDRDIVVRALAKDLDPNDTRLADICSKDLVSLSPDDTLGDAEKLMRKHDVRRLVVLDGGTPVGVVSLGDLAVTRDSGDALADQRSQAQQLSPSSPSDEARD
ncbi:MAG: CBS domain-containing protein [Actinobacteria bacterium]|nr:CBS domain-containing protein [Actinomycetota bacterium]